MKVADMLPPTSEAGARGGGKEGDKKATSDPTNERMKCGSYHKTAQYPAVRRLSGRYKRTCTIVFLFFSCVLPDRGGARISSPLTIDVTKD